MLIEKISRPGKKAAGSANRLKAQTLVEIYWQEVRMKESHYKSYDDLPLFHHNKNSGKGSGRVTI